ncbi:MAG: CPBP family intramembrane glutamic endopeptidase [Dehalococcoidia bacterium]
MEADSIKRVSEGTGRRNWEEEGINRPQIGDGSPVKPRKRRTPPLFRVFGMPVRGNHIIIFGYVLLIGLAEMLVTYEEPTVGMLLHAVIMFVLFAHAAFVEPFDRDMANLLMSIGIAPLIRIVSLSAPLSDFNYIHWFLILSIPLFAAILVLRKLQGLNERALGLTISWRILPWELLIALTGFPLGIAEFYISRPGPLLSEITLQSMIAPVLIMIVCTGLIEEIIFRGFVQHNANRVFGAWIGIPVTSILFGLLHIGNMNLGSVLFAFGVGLMYSLWVRRTGSIFGVSLSHGILNSMLFLVAPMYY